MRDTLKIREHMPVIAADDRRVGFVARVEGSDSLKVTRVKNGHGSDHVIPLAWVSDVDRYVFLNKSSKFVVANWETPLGHARAA
jgi:hypothetical protein